MSHELLEVDQKVSTHLRVRLWCNRGPRCTRFGQQVGHDEVEVTWVERGLVRFHVDRQEHLVRPGEAIVLPAYVGHGTTFEGATRVGSVRLGSEMLAQVAESMESAVKRTGLAPGLVADASRIIGLGRMLEVEVREQAPGQLMMIDALAEALAVAVLRGGPRQGGSCRRIADPRILKVLEYIESNSAEAISLRDLAEVACLSRYHFSRLFREVVGLSPYRYLIQVRLDLAARLIRRGRCNATDAALGAGFMDHGRFARMFRERFGCKPSEFRHLIIQGRR